MTTTYLVYPTFEHSDAALKYTQNGAVGSAMRVFGSRDKGIVHVGLFVC
jgi:hypothetical protein